MPDHPRVEIPEISNRRLGYLARIIRPVISYRICPRGQWPQDEVRTHFIKLPKDLRGDTFLKNISLGRVARFNQVAKLRTFHELGSAGREFFPTIAEVLAQIPEEYLGSGPIDPEDPGKVIAFETFLPDQDPVMHGSLSGGYFHAAITVLLTKALPYSKTLERFHYS